MEANAKGSSMGEFDVFLSRGSRVVSRVCQEAFLTYRLGRRQTSHAGFQHPSGGPRLVTAPRVQGEWSRDSPCFRAWPRGVHTAAAVSPLPELTTWTPPRAQVAGECGLE